jgi:hypothetical protein
MIHNRSGSNISGMYQDYKVCILFDLIRQLQRKYRENIEKHLVSNFMAVAMIYTSAFKNNLFLSVESKLTKLIIVCSGQAFEAHITTISTTDCAIGTRWT